MSDYERDVNSNQDNKTQILYKLIDDSLHEEIKNELKLSVKNLAQQAAELVRLEEYVSKVNSDDIIVQYYGLNQCRKLLSNSNPGYPIEQLIEMVLSTNVLLKIFDIAKMNNIPLLKYEALWIISNIVYGTKYQIQTILDNDGINILFLALDSKYDEIIELGVWSLANIAGDNVQFRDMLLQKGIVNYIGKLWRQYKTTKSELFKTIVWALSNLAKGKPTTKLCLKQLIQILCEILISTDDEEQLIDITCGLSYLSEDIIEIDSYQKINIIIDIKLHLIILNSTKHTIVIPALKIIGNILSGSDEQTNQVLQAGALQVFEILLQRKNKSIRREVCWSLSNIVAGTQPQIQQIVKNDGLLKSLFKQLEQGDLDITKQIAFFISNFALYAELTDLEYLATNYGFIEKLSMLLDKNDEQVIQVTLEGIFKFFSKIQIEGQLSVYKQLIEDQKIILKIIQLQSHPSDTIYENALKILDILVPKEQS